MKKRGNSNAMAKSTMVKRRCGRKCVVHSQRKKIVSVDNVTGVGGAFLERESSEKAI